MVGHERIVTHTIILVCYHIEINQQPLKESVPDKGQYNMSLMETEVITPTRSPPLT